MNGYQILEMLKQKPDVAQLVAGIWCGDALKLKCIFPPYYPCVFIVNTNSFTNVNMTPGHWVVFHFKRNQQDAEFFCSGGLSPVMYPEHFEAFLLRHAQTYTYNCQPLQDPASCVCGLYALMYIHAIHKGYNVKEYVDMNFTCDLKVNDQLVKSYINKEWSIFNY